MSMTAVRPTNSIARDEYSAFEPANRRYRPRLRRGAAKTPTEAVALDLIASRRVIRRARELAPLILGCSFHGNARILGVENLLAHRQLLDAFPAHGIPEARNGGHHGYPFASAFALRLNVVFFP